MKEIISLLDGLDVTIKNLKEFPDFEEVVEDGATLEANAIKKAREAFLHTRIPALADDTGLEVFQMNLRPGVYSARYAGEHATYEDNYLKLLNEMKDIPSSQRSAQFRCVAAFVGHDIEKITIGVCKGVITLEPQGSGGFGYDPVFIPEGLHQTFAELSFETKNRISHRAKAFLQMKEFLSRYFSSMNSS